MIWCGRGSTISSTVRANWGPASVEDEADPWHYDQEFSGGARKGSIANIES